MTTLTLNELSSLLELVAFHQKKQGISQGSSLVERIRYVVSEYESRAVEALSSVKQEREDTRVFLRAIGLLVATCGNADTHKEKNARLRAVSEMIESAVSKLAQSEANFMMSRGVDLFRADFPTRHLVDRIRSLQRELEEYQKPTQEVPCQSPSPSPAPSEAIF